MTRISCDGRRAGRACPRGRPAEGIAVGRDRAADPAGDPLGLRRLDRTSSRCCSAAIFGNVDLRRASRTRCWRELRDEWHGVGAFMLHGLPSPPFWLAVAGIAAAVTATWSTRRCRRACRRWPARSTRCSTTSTTSTVQRLVLRGRRAGESAHFASSVGDRRVIDGFFVNGSAKVVGLGGAADAPHPVRLRLPLRVHDDRRRRSRC